MRRLLCLIGMIDYVGAAICKEGVMPICGEEFAAYNRTFLPNLLGDWSTNQISYSASIFYPLRAVGCSEHLDLFLCSTLSPACVDENPEGVLPYLIPVPPCFSLCQKVSMTNMYLRTKSRFSGSEGSPERCKESREDFPSWYHFQ